MRWASHGPVATLVVGTPLHVGHSPRPCGVRRLPTGRPLGRDAPASDGVFPTPPSPTSTPRVARKLYLSLPTGLATYHHVLWNFHQVGFTPLQACVPLFAPPFRAITPLLPPLFAPPFRAITPLLATLIAPFLCPPPHPTSSKPTQTLMQPQLRHKSSNACLPFRFVPIYTTCCLPRKICLCFSTCSSCSIRLPRSPMSKFVILTIAIRDEAPRALFSIEHSRDCASSTGQ